ncbi:MAG: 1,4-dihydroxy-2-naphthoyl-CoA synthase [Bifidobacteriaceae bacterium]|jgi:naphthoate synthase|nr:1,4-dihydroxy-2-naphthoyl-CoA synthase [Bifidobacteriaceae bacterium]
MTDPNLRAALPTLKSAGFTPELWRDVPGFESLTGVTYHRGVNRAGPGAAGQPGQADQPWVRIAFNRPEVRNAFDPTTVDELIAALRHAADSPDVMAVLLTGNGPSPKDGGHAFCSGGDQRFRGASGYEYAAPARDRRTPGPPDAQGDNLSDAVGAASGTASPPATGRLHILEAQRLVRTMPKVVIALVDGWAAGGGHSLAVVADLTIACREHGRFKQTDATVGSFDAGYGSALLARQVGQKRARQIFFLAETYTAEQAEAWGAINAAVPHEAVEASGIAWAARVAEQSPTAIRVLKFAFNLADDGLAGQQVFAAEATRLAYGSAEGAEGRDAFLERRPPEWAAFRKQIL